MASPINKNTHTDVRCQYCGKIFEVYTSDFKRRTPKYCSYECYHNAEHKKALVTVACKNCGREFTKIRCKDKMFCDIKCACEYRRNRPRKVTVSQAGYRNMWTHDGAVKEHRYIMEQYLGRKLREDECVHHIDFNRQNNDISNLVVMTRSEHSKLHRQIEKNRGTVFFRRKKDEH